MKDPYLHVSESSGNTDIDIGTAVSGAITSPRGWILYDGDCRFCSAAAVRFGPTFSRRGLAFVSLQTAWVQRRLGLEPNEPLVEMRVLTAKGNDLGGANAVLFLARQVWWLSPFWLLGKLPGMHLVVDAGYRWIAAHRACTHLTGKGVCRLPLANRKRRRNRRTSLRIRTFSRALPMVLLPVGALLLRGVMEPWMFMWAMVAAIFVGCKWFTLERAKSQGCRARIGRQLAYLFLWVGMDAESFLAPAQRSEPLHRAVRDLAFSFAKIALGIVLLFGIARHFDNPLVSGWIGMTGAILILHFGVFEVTAISWRMLGVAARPIMDAPLRSGSLAEFWSRRWNRAFHQLVMDLFFRRFTRAFGAVRATLTAFFISGLVHELVISLPAGGGYGLPAGYFLLQGWGVIAQRTVMRKRVWLGRGVVGRIFTFGVVGAPAFGLFHPPFVRRVIIPFMQAIGAI